MNDWYKAMQEDIHKNGGSRPLGYYYNNSPSKASMSVYPQHNWELDKFEGKLSVFWKNMKNCQQSFI